MEAVSTSEKSAFFFHNTWRNITEDSHFLTNFCPTITFTKVYPRGEDSVGLKLIFHST
jgi:hypothetical protein